MGDRQEQRDRLAASLSCRVVGTRCRTMNRNEEWKSDFQLLVGVTLIALLGVPLLLAEPPIVRSVIPETVAAGTGQLIAIQGFHLDPARAKVALNSKNDDKTYGCLFVLKSSSDPSNDNELYVRLGRFNPYLTSECPQEFTVPAGRYAIAITTPAGRSNEIDLQVTERPAKPVPQKLCFYPGSKVKAKAEHPDPGCPKLPPHQLTSKNHGGLVAVEAYGTDTTGLEAVMVQGRTELPEVQGTFTSRAPGAGMLHWFEVPPGLLRGAALVELRTKVCRPSRTNCAVSDNSFGLIFDFEP